MSSDKSSSRLNQIVLKARSERDNRERGYREVALKMYPWVCGRCSREFTRQNVRELTVHHKDHNHDNNPADGSNWELLCVYCHDNEHSRHTDSAYMGNEVKTLKSTTTHKPFADLADLLKKK